MSLALSGADAGHLTAAVGLTYALGFERALRGATAGDRVFAMIGAGSGVIGGGLVFRRAIGRGEVVVAGVATALTMFTLEIRHMKVLNVLDGRRWSGHFRDDEPPPGSAGAGDPGAAADSDTG